jgi:hypothetical protein
VVDVELAEAIRGCEEGLFEKIDASKLPKGGDGSDARADFLPGMVNDCAIANIDANVVAFDRAKFASNAPSRLEDFFDLQKYPGKRGMKKEPNVNLEWALMADGVPAADVYKVLGDSAGVDRAFRKLDTIKSQIVWWSAGAQPPQLLASGEVVMTSVFHGRIYNANKDDKRNFAVVWDGPDHGAGPLRRHEGHEERQGGHGLRHVRHRHQAAGRPDQVHPLCAGAQVLAGTRRGRHQALAARPGAGRPRLHDQRRVVGRQGRRAEPALRRLGGALSAAARQGQGQRDTPWCRG